MEIWQILLAVVAGAAVVALSLGACAVAYAAHVLVPPLQGLIAREGAAVDKIEMPAGEIPDDHTGTGDVVEAVRNAQVAANDATWGVRPGPPSPCSPCAALRAFLGLKRPGAVAATTKPGQE